MDTLDEYHYKDKNHDANVFISKYNALVGLYKKKVITQEEFKKYALRIIGVEE